MSDATRPGGPGEADWARIEAVFIRAIELPRDRRAEFLDRVCGEEPALLRRLETLLKAHDQAGTGFLEGLDPIRARALLDHGQPAPPETLGRFEVVRPLGRGGMGVVYLARDPALDRHVAVKLLAGDRGADPAADRRLLDEARAASALDHPNIATVYEVGETDHGRYIAMAYYDGETLRQHMASAPLPEQEAVTLTAQVAEGLAAAHASGIFHRDIKPENLILTTQGLVKIVDFGVAMVSARTDTTRGGAPGTIAYMSPEQTRGERVDARADIWALGVILYEMLTGGRPFRGDDSAAVIYGIRHQSPPAVHSLRPDITPALAAVVERCLAKEPEHRFHSAAAVADALRASSTTAPTARRPDRRRDRRTIPATAATATLIAVVALAAILALGAAMGGADRSAADAGAHAGVPWAEREPLVLADFTASTEDPRIGRVVTEALRIDLLQSPALRLAEGPDVADGLRRMGLDPSDGVPEAAARQVALRDGYKAVVAGEVGALGGGYVLTARVLDAANGRTVAAFRETATDSVGLIDAVDRLAKAVREQAGESLGTLAAARPLPQVATASLPALRRYAEGYAIGWTGGDQARAAQLFQEAVGLDSTFAAAHRALSIAYWNMRADRARTIAATRAAYELRHRLSERERYFTEAIYYWHVLGDPTRTADAYRRLLAIDPGHQAGRTNLGLALLFDGEPAEAERVLRSHTAPGDPPDALRLNLARALYFQGRSQAALALIDSLGDRPGGSPAAEVLRARILGGDARWVEAETTARALLDAHEEGGHVRAESLRLLWHLALVRGQVARADRVAAELVPLLRRLGTLDELARVRIQDAEVRWTLLGDREGARARLYSLLDDPTVDLLRAGATLPVRAAAALAALGDTARAKELLEVWDALPEESRGDPDHFSPELARARIDMQAGRYTEAARRLQDATAGTIQGLNYLPDLAHAHQRAGRPDSAITALHRYLAFRHTRKLHRVPGYLGPALIQLAELHQTAGDTAGAIAAHARLAELWDEADPELRPRVVHARAQIAALSSADR